MAVQPVQGKGKSKRGLRRARRKENKAAQRAKEELVDELLKAPKSSEALNIEWVSEELPDEVAALASMEIKDPTELNDIEKHAQAEAIKQAEKDPMWSVARAFQQTAAVESLTMSKEERVQLKKMQEKNEEERRKLEEEVGEDEEEHDAFKEEEENTISNKQRKKNTRLSVAQLKQLVRNPEAVELHDPNSPDPQLLMFLKSCRNAVPVPIHWCQKRKYLQGKRGLERKPFELPAFIADTGIAKIRGAQLEAEAAASAKSKARQRMQPKMGRMDIDYQILHDAFFKYQTKPRMTKFGESYFEGREFEIQLGRFKPGQLSASLRAALHIKDNGPPPWLINMQRYGPPPSYPELRLPGLNAPLPEGQVYGYGEGQWGKPPVDESGRPLYGNPFGQSDLVEDDDDVDRTLWGEMEEEEESSDEEAEEESEAEMEPQEDAAPSSASVLPYTQQQQSGVSSIASGISSVSSGIETPREIELRKAEGIETPEVDLRKPFRELQEKESSIGKAAFGTAKVYEGIERSSNPQGTGLGGASLPNKQGEYTVELDPSELENLDEATLKRKYQERAAAETAEDRDGKRRKKGGRKSDSYGDFKF